MLPPAFQTHLNPMSMPAAASRRPHCARCLRPASTCLCRFITPSANQLRLLVLQHPQEQHQAKGTVRLLQLSLQRCQVEVGQDGPDGAVFDPAALATWLQPPAWQGHSLLLYPASPRSSPQASDQALAGVGPLAKPEACLLVLLDGTWRQSRQMLRANPLLHQLPRWALPETLALAPARYQVRKAHRPEQRASLEAACAALAVLEGQPGRYAPLLERFEAWLATLGRSPG